MSSVLCLEEKASKVHQCLFTSDDAKCVLEVQLVDLRNVSSLIFFASVQDMEGNDSEVQTLRACLQQVEKDGMIDFKLGGHEAIRPGGVFNGHQDDMFLSLHHLIVVSTSAGKL